MTIDWTAQLAEQLDWHWDNQLRPRLAGLTDAEYFWEPVTHCWSVRHKGQQRTTTAFGGGEFVVEVQYPEPQPVPVTTIGWRLAHLIASVLLHRVGSHFGGPVIDPRTYDYPGTAGDALARLDEAHAAWRAGVLALDADGLEQPCGAAEGPFAEYPMAALVLHINREMLHHGAEVALLRDLYAHR